MPQSIPIPAALLLCAAALAAPAAAQEGDAPAAADDDSVVLPPTTVYAPDDALSESDRKLRALLGNLPDLHADEVRERKKHWTQRAAEFTIRGFLPAPVPERRDDNAADRAAAKATPQAQQAQKRAAQMP